MSEFVHSKQTDVFYESPFYVIILINNFKNKKKKSQNYW